MLRPILQLETHEKTLRTPARTLTKEEILSDKIQALIEEMKTIMRNAPGVGLAAPQIGESVQLAVIEDSEERFHVLSPEVLKERERVSVPFHVIINPTIVHLNESINRFFEGCLSVKGKARVTERWNMVRVECLDERGEKKEIVASGWYARILQHEIDHLNGTIYVDKADGRTEISTTDEEYKTKWLNASKDTISEFVQTKCGV